MQDMLQQCLDADDLLLAATSVVAAGLGDLAMIYGDILMGFNQTYGAWRSKKYGDVWSIEHDENMVKTI